MLYQLSYASTAKPSKIIIEAIELQAFLGVEQTPCQSAGYHARDFLLRSRLGKLAIIK
jgi:hypothetical protein